MRRRSAGALTVAIALVLAVLTPAGCTRAINGTPSAAPQLQCPEPTAALVSCLSASLSAFWTREAGRPVAVHIQFDPTSGQVPNACRSAVALRTAFTCPVNDVIYLTAPFERRLRSTGPAGDAWVRIAATLAHETGHVLQLAVHDPLVLRHNTFAESRTIEQQADCLSGVWASSVGIDAARFRAATAVVLTVIDDRWERRTHGAPAQRLAAVRRGQLGRTAAACHLTLR